MYSRFNIYDRVHRLFASGHPLAQLLSLLVLGAAVVGVVLMGAFVLSFLIGAALLATAVFATRLWWLRFKLRRGARQRERVGANRHGRLIEAEYTIVEEREARRRRRQ